jgi:hypothetical protein
MTLWQANDESTATIMGDFYKYLASGSSKGAALRSAKLDYLTSVDELRSHPYFWAHFIANGDLSPLVKRDSSMYFLFGGLFIVLLILIVRKRKTGRQTA